MDSPKAPDPYATAAAQTQSNIQTAKTQQELNMVNQSNPYGSLTYSVSGTNADGTPQYTATTTLTPTGQTLFDNANALAGKQQSIANTLLSGGQGAFSGQPLDLSYNGTAASLDALNKARLDPQWQQNQSQLEAQLAAQGLQPGMPGYDAAFRNFSTAKNDAYNSANLADYQTAVNNAITQYQMPLQTYSTLVNGTSPQMPNSAAVSTPTTNVAGTDIAGLVQKNYEDQLNQSNATMGGLFGLGGTLGGSLLQGIGKAGGMASFFSDRRLKSDIVRIGTLENGLPVYEYTIFGGRQRGVMADEVEQVMPDAVFTHPSGFKMVNYAALGLA
ncbi:tail fiber domain-containing protein [Bradyrhizobium sp. BRP56]|uniref:tail fiber domain-containing protein n=1 Tax=Bradyrhizobium sp. BRP56 TaxID=2793819 RepID=UPI001CD7E548|nr:tail fiber domain-containing protein [Bradyrhizobium sp. BRP56]MCA1400049.1 tail fiber domain-containing protein [Bradyrhizobium sp. BRP56]